MNQFMQETLPCLTESPIQLSVGQKTGLLRAEGEAAWWVCEYEKQDGQIRIVTNFLFVPGCHLLSHYSLPSLCKRANVCVCLTQATAIAWHCHEGSQCATNDAVRPAKGGFLEGAGVLVQKGVHAM